METYHPCFVRSSFDALILLNGALRGHTNVVNRRLTQFELDEHITSGAVFVYDEHTSEIKRWTDKRLWSASRAIGAFFGYLEMNQPGEKSLDKSRSKLRPSDNKDSLEHDLMGALESMVSSHRYKRDGLVKRTFAVPGLGIHLINYVKPSDVRDGLLNTPSNMPCYDYLRRVEGFSQELLDAPHHYPLHMAIGDDGTYISSKPAGQRISPEKHSGDDNLELDSNSSFAPTSPPPAYNADPYPHHESSVPSDIGSPSASDSTFPSPSLTSIPPHQFLEYNQMALNHLPYESHQALYPTEVQMDVFDTPFYPYHTELVYPTSISTPYTSYPHEIPYFDLAATARDYSDFSNNMNIVGCIEKYDGDYGGEALRFQPPFY